MSRFLAQREARRRELGAELVAAVAGIREDEDPENARLALDFCLDHFARPQTSQFVLRAKDVSALYERVAAKMHAFSEHARADKLMRCVRDAEASIQDESVFAAVASTLHMLSHAPTRTELDEDTRLLREARLADGTLTDQPTADQLLLEVRDRLNLRKAALLRELQDLPDDLVGQDWLDETFSSSSKLSDLASDDGGSAVFLSSPAPSPAASPTASVAEDADTEEVAMTVTAGFATGEQIDQEKDGRDDVWLALRKASPPGTLQEQIQRARNQDLLVDEHGPVRTAPKHFNARCYEACVRRFKSREDLASEGAEALVPGGRDRIVHEAELCRAILLALQGIPTSGLVILASSAADQSLHTAREDSRRPASKFRLCEAVSLAHTSRQALEHQLAPLLRAADQLQESRTVCSLLLFKNRATLPMTFQRTAAFIRAHIDEAIRDRIVALEVAVQRGGISQELAANSPSLPKAAPTLLSVSQDAAPIVRQAEVLWEATLTLSRTRPSWRELDDADDALAEASTADQDARKASKNLLDALFAAALDDHIMHGGASGPSHGLANQIFRAGMAAQVEILGRFLYEGRLRDHFREFFVSVNEPVSGGGLGQGVGNVLLHPAPRAWQPMYERVYVLCDAVEMLRRLAAQDGSRHAGWPPWPADIGLRALRLHESLDAAVDLRSAETSSAPWRAGITDDETHPAVALLTDDLFAPLNELGSIVGKTVMREVMDEHCALTRLSELRGVFFMQNELSLQVFLRDVFAAADRDLLPEDDRVACAIKAYWKEFTEDTRVPRGYLAPHAVGGASAARFGANKHEIDDEQRSALLTRLLHADLEDHLGQSSLDRIRVDFHSAPVSDRFKSYGVRALAGVKLAFDVQPPLDAIVDDEALDMYSAIFNFLLVIKRTALVLCRLQHNLRRDTLSRRKEGAAATLGEPAGGAAKTRATSRNAGANSARMHRINLMLVEHLHFVSNLHAFVVHRLADVSWTRFVAEARQATRIDHVYELHRAYLRRVCVQCMIAPDSPHAATRVREAVDEMLECSLRFRVLVIALWRGSGSGSEDAGATPEQEEMHAQGLWKSITGVHAKFQRASRFLLIMLSQRASLGGAKHLEDVLTRLDFNQACRRKPTPAQSFPGQNASASISRAGSAVSAGALPLSFASASSLPPRRRPGSGAR